MDEKAGRTLADDVRAAFRDVRRGRGTSLHEARAMDDYEGPAAQYNARGKDTDDHWWEIPQSTIEELYDAFLFLDAEGMRYYLAPFLIYFLEHHSSDWPVTDWAISHLGNKDKIEDFSIFDEVQARVVARYLQFVSLCGEDDVSLAQSAVEALHNYWRQFLPADTQHQS